MKVYRIDNGNYYIVEVEMREVGISWGIDKHGGRVFMNPTFCTYFNDLFEARRHVVETIEAEYSSAWNKCNSLSKMLMTVKENGVEVRSE